MAVNDGKEYVVSIVIDSSIERVWEEITKTGRLQRAVYNTVLEGRIEPGARLRYYSPDRKRVFVVGEVLEVEVPRLFVHTYFMTMHSDPFTTVAWELEEVVDDAGQPACRVTIRHTGWTEEHRTGEKTAKGWTEILGLLKSEVESGTIPLKTRVLYRVMGWMSFMLPKTTRTQHADEQGW